MGQHYDDVIKAQVLAALIAGQSISQVAQRYKIPVGTVKCWSARRDAVVEPKSTIKTRIGELLIGYLEESLFTATEQQRLFRNEEWLKKQSASELAVLHGVSLDKAIRLLEALAEQDECSKIK